MGGTRRPYSNAYPEVGLASWPADFLIRRKRLAVAAVALLALLTLVSVLGLKSATETTFVVIIDSGSTGTRVYVYRWEGRGVGELPNVTLLEPTRAEVLAHRKAAGFQRGAYIRIETEPGLDKAAGDGAKVKGALGPLLDWARRTIPSSYHSSSPIFLFGTAGLRKLPPNLQSSLLTDVRQLLDASPFRFEADWVRVIEGADEGIYGWVGLNYMQGHIRPALLGKVASPGELPRPSSMESEVEGQRPAAPHELRTVGSLDLGGSSLEVTFIPESWPGTEYESVGVDVLGSRYTLYTHSFKGYGMNDAFDKGVTLLVEARLAQDPAAFTLGDVPPVLEHPCMQVGYSNSFTRKDPGWAPAVGVASPRPASSLGAHIPAVTLRGVPNWGACRELAAKVVAASGTCARPPCTLGAESPPPRGNFFAMSGFYVVYEFFKLPLTASLQELEDAGRAYCDRDWADIQTQLGDIKNTETYCFRAPFVSSLLSDGLGMPASHFHILQGGFGWTLGAAIVEGSRLAGIGTDLHAAKQPRTRGPGGMQQQLASLGPTKLLIAALFLLAWIFLLGSAVFQYGHFLWWPWTGRSPAALADAAAAKLRQSDSGDIGGGAHSPSLASKRWGASVPEVRIPVMTGIGSGKIVSSPPPMRSSPPSAEGATANSYRDQMGADGGQIGRTAR